MGKSLSYWVAVALMGFHEDIDRLLEDFPNKMPEFLNEDDPPENYDLQTMVQLARSVGGVLQVRVIKEHGEVVRVVDYETARRLDSRLSQPCQQSQLVQQPQAGEDHDQDVDHLLDARVDPGHGADRPEQQADNQKDDDEGDEQLHGVTSGAE